VTDGRSGLRRCVRDRSRVERELALGPGSSVQGLTPTLRPASRAERVGLRFVAGRVPWFYGTRSGGWRVNRLGYGRCQGPAASGEGAGWPVCQALAARIR
jgi:hypothetical protein